MVVGTTGLAVGQKSKVFALLVFAFLVSTFPSHDGGVNPRSRLAAMSAFSEQASFEISRYQERKEPWTIDWSRTSDGRVYSNKAPGSVFLGLPFFLMADRMANPFWKSASGDRNARDYWRMEKAVWLSYGVAFFTQIVPMIICSWFLLSAFASLSAGALAAVAFLWGTTGGLFASVLFGHALTHWLIVASILALRAKNSRASILWAGAFFGVAATTDYLVLILTPVWFFYLQKRRMLFLRGMALPVLVLAIYHWHIFGAPWNFPQKFNNPVFVSEESNRPLLWGVLALMPNLEALWELFLGSKRGLLFTQPWVLICVSVAAWRLRQFEILEKRFIVCAISSLVVLLWVNASFNNWDAGVSPGPRYLTAGLSPFVFLFGELASEGRGLILWLAGIILSSAIFVLANSITFTVPSEPLWAFYSKNILDAHPVILAQLSAKAGVVIGAIVSVLALRVKEIESA